ncbi:FKBP-type peptidyl-prolyl cis-trans isomerase [Aerophototrophica crusticola]|uniref:Peptidyl-prolyl cis-trans isomerase n=1 Tax=Aerophototrophica crusticola TaxID=1709002 RepID=A0A858R6Y6_9PROT|nr:FKBP-type peptidyl-prolyl cis-trans isomerase [Rhodospirillaceae bacterium B3]
MKTRTLVLIATLLAMPPAGLIAMAQQAPSTPPEAAQPTPDPQRQYLAQNAKQPGWQVTPSGLQFKIDQRATNPAAVRPALTDIVTVHYRGTLIDGKEFDSSYKRGQPATFPLNRLIRGWQEGISMMRVGEKWQFAIPSDLGYGPKGAGDDIPPGATLLFTVELLDVRKPDNTNLLDPKNWGR